jgi:hypothetical protein
MRSTSLFDVSDEQLNTVYGGQPAESPQQLIDAGTNGPLISSVCDEIVPTPPNIAPAKRAYACTETDFTGHRRTWTFYQIDKPTPSVLRAR